MGIRRHFEGVACARFGDDQAEEKAPHKNAAVGKGRAVADLGRENAELRQRVGRLELELAEVKREKDFAKSVSGVTASPAGKRGRKPTLTPEEKQRKSSARVKAWRDAKRNP